MMSAFISRSFPPNQLCLTLFLKEQKAVLVWQGLIGLYVADYLLLFSLGQAWHERPLLLISTRMSI